MVAQVMMMKNMKMMNTNNVVCFFVFYVCVGELEAQPGKQRDGKLKQFENHGVTGIII